MKAKTICLMNNKGGVGKSTSCGTISGILADLNKKVLIVDCDPQGNSSQLFNSYRTTPKTIIDLFMIDSQNVNYDTVNDCIYHTEINNIDIIAANEDFTFTCDDITRDNTRIQQLILKKTLSTIKEFYDFIIIDNSPFFNIISINSLCASDYVITPVESDGFGYKGLIQLLKKINSVKSELNEDLEFLGVFMNKTQVTTNIARDLYLSYKDELEENFIPVYIRLDNQAKESNTCFIPLTKFSPKCNAIKDYKKLIADLHILDDESQCLLTTEVKQIYGQEIAAIEKKYKSNGQTPSEIISFQLEVLQKNLKRL